jgi:hypothetical protein
MERSEVFVGGFYFIEDKQTDLRLLVEVLAINDTNYYCYDHLSDTYITAVISDFDDERLRIPTKAELVLYRKSISMDKHLDIFKRRFDLGLQIRSKLETPIGEFIRFRG